MKKWHSGPPPSIGWWPFKYHLNDHAPHGQVSWWNGEYWSVACDKGDSRVDAAYYAKCKSVQEQARMVWSKRPASWPKRSRT